MLHTQCFVSFRSRATMMMSSVNLPYTSIENALKPLLECCALVSEAKASFACGFSSERGPSEPRSMQSRSRRRRDRDRRHAILATHNGVREPASREKPNLPLCPSTKVTLCTVRDARRTCFAQCPSTKVTLFSLRDARRTCRAHCPSTKVTLCIAPSLLQHLPSLMVHHLHLWCTSWDVLDTVSCILCGSSCCCPCCDLHGRGRVGCSGIRYHVWSCTCPDILGTTSCDVRGSFSCWTRCNLHGRAINAA